MMGSWWFLWMMFMFVFLLPPLGYGWGYRGWGPPYPRYMQRRRAQQATALGGSSTFNHYAWGTGGDIMWMIVLVAAFWGFIAYWWR